MKLKSSLKVKQKVPLLKREAAKNTHVKLLPRQPDNTSQQLKRKPAKRQINSRVIQTRPAKDHNSVQKKNLQQKLDVRKHVVLPQRKTQKKQSQAAAGTNVNQRHSPKDLDKDANRHNRDHHRNLFLPMMHFDVKRVRELRRQFKADIKQYQRRRVVVPDHDAGQGQGGQEDEEETADVQRQGVQTVRNHNVPHHNQRGDRRSHDQSHDRPRVRARVPSLDRRQTQTHHDHADASDSNSLHRPQAHRNNDDENAVAKDNDRNEDDTMYYKKINLEELKPPDHMDAVRMEQDGHLNRDYKKEIFLGEHEKLDHATEAEKKAKLREIFTKADTDSDEFLTQTELQEWIAQKVQEHFDEAVEENEKIFQSLDSDKDGYITWKEFHIQYLLSKGYDLEKAKRESEGDETIPLDNTELEDFRTRWKASDLDHDHKLNKLEFRGFQHPELHQNFALNLVIDIMRKLEKDRLIRYKFRWSEADTDPQDRRLSEREFRLFRHPEQSPGTIQRMVGDIIDNLDKDHDGVVTEEEFVALPPGELDAQFKDSDKEWQEERRKEFRTVIDLNHDGELTKDELKKYFDPKNPNNAVHEARNLISLADVDKDGKLSLSEVLENIELFFGSKMVNAERNFHDEF